ncbi:sensor histidine kinase [Loktanella sp. S4079]|uniref:sensor histidine kinase n=1 Tax=Loktanella sp. S4079 TaxID=579483 RepID=UPI0006960451|nr:HAMP domain-containing sensor histidine kinase [Loktanella sp. S4079]
MLSKLRSLFRSLWRLSALRQALLLTVIFLAVLAGAALFALLETRDAMDRRVDGRLEARFAEIQQSIADGTFNPELGQLSSLERVSLLSRGDQNYGRAGVFFDDELIPDSGRMRGQPKEPWLFLGGPVSGGWLIVGQNVGELTVFDEVLADTLFAVGWIALVVALSFGLVLGWRSQQRLSEITQVLTRAAEGDLTARVNPASDRDDLDQLGHQVDEAITRIAAALEKAKGFSANIAHDLKTPLTRLRIRLEAALLTDNDPRAEIGAALEQTDKAIAIFDAFLRLSKLESGALEKRFELVDISSLAQRTAETYAPVIEDSGRHLTTDISDATVVGDPVLLNQFLQNLIQNALRHTPEGSTVTIIAKPGILGVTDNGPGIPVDEYARVVEPLYRLDRSRTTEGAGLGLSLAHTIATRHGAEFQLSKAPQHDSGLFVRMIWDISPKS